MRFQLMMFPAALVAAAPLQAADYLTIEQAQAALFPEATFTPADLLLTEAQVDDLLKTVAAPVFRTKVRAWKVSTGGWFILDQGMGRDDRVTYAIGIDKNGVVKGIEILVCLPEYSGIRSPRWRDQFIGKQSFAFTDIANISGTTLSVEHISEGVRRTIATYAKFIAQKAG